MKKIFIFFLLLCLPYNPLSAMKRSRDNAQLNKSILSQEFKSSLNPSNFYNASFSFLPTLPGNSIDANRIPCNNCGQLFTTIYNCLTHEAHCEQQSLKIEQCLKIERLKRFFQTIPLQEKHDNPPIKKRKTNVEDDLNEPLNKKDLSDWLGCL